MRAPNRPREQNPFHPLYTSPRGRHTHLRFFLPSLPVSSLIHFPPRILHHFHPSPRCLQPLLLPQQHIHTLLTLLIPQHIHTRTRPIIIISHLSSVCLFRSKQRSVTPLLPHPRPQSPSLVVATAHTHPIFRKQHTQKLLTVPYTLSAILGNRVTTTTRLKVLTTLPTIPPSSQLPAVRLPCSSHPATQYRFPDVLPLLLNKLHPHCNKQQQQQQNMPFPTYHLLLFLLLFLPTIFSIPTPPQAPRTTTRSSSCPVILPLEKPLASRTAIQPRIIGGDPSPSSSQLFTLALRSPLSQISTRKLCTAARLSTSWGVTAAHCGVNDTWTAQLPDGSVAAIAQVYPHENYQVATDRVYDIAVFRLEDGVADAERVVRVNSRVESPVPGAFVRVLGYGASIFDRVSGTDLRQVDIPVVPFDKCAVAYETVANTGSMDSDAQVCAGYMDAGGCDSCEGDSGGPVVQYNADGKPVLVALVSAGRGCAEPGYPGINLRVGKYVDWMKEKGAVFSSDDAPVQVMLEGDYPGKPPTGEVQIVQSSPPEDPGRPPEKPAPAPPAPKPDAVASRPSPTPAEEDADEEPKEPNAPAPAPSRRPAPSEDDANAEEDSVAASGAAPSVSPGMVGEAPSVSPSSDFPIVTDPTPTATPTAAGPGSGTKPSASPEVTQVPGEGGPFSAGEEEEESGESGEDEDEDDGQGPTGTGNGGENESRQPKTAGTRGDARTAGIVGGTIAGLIVVGGVATLIFKLR